ncbi:hypothetical protein CE91St43_29090 [Oscillospiraceae bacterium]|nr:hypothetical protein CE91St43_29090 [Oscillospiraceae bacterium]
MPLLWKPPLAVHMSVRKPRGRYEVRPRGSFVWGFPWGKLSAKQTDEGNLSF